MKRFVFITLLILFISGLAQSQSAGAIPKKVNDSFAVQYPRASSVKWKTGKSEYSAQFSQEKKKYTAFYSLEGAWLRTESKIGLSNQLPQIVQDSLHKSSYVDWKITGIWQVDEPAKKLYRLDVNDSNKLSGDNHHALTDHFLLWFDEKGHLVKKQKLR